MCNSKGCESTVQNDEFISVVFIYYSVLEFFIYFHYCRLKKSKTKKPRTNPKIQAKTRKI